MKKLKLIICICCSIGLLSLGNSIPNKRSIAVDHTLAHFKEHSIAFAHSTNHLENIIRQMDIQDSSGLIKVKEALISARKSYKEIEYFLNYFFKSIALAYNAPAAVEVEEPSLEAREPTGLQVIEAILFEENPLARKNQMLEQANLLNSSAIDLNSLLFNLNIDDKKILESIRLEIINTSLLGMAGFDAPELKTGIVEAKSSMITIREILSPYLTAKSKAVDSVRYYLDNALLLIEQNNDFDSFDRLAFLTEASLPLQYHLGLLIVENGLEINTTGSINYQAPNIFSKNSLDITKDLPSTPDIINLGKKLFFEKSLSGNFQQNCASCHQPDKYFTDQLAKSLAIDGINSVERNAPTLYYSALQHLQFWDGRASNLEEQIQTVLQNPHEMNADLKIIIQRLSHKKEYVDLFTKAYPNETDSAITIRNLSLSIAAFLKTLSPFNSPFDKYLQGNKQMMNEQQIRGFNLFMGKAQCGTCHFAPVFNGTLPPAFNITDVEVLGTTLNTDFDKPLLDMDSGRFNKYSVPYYMRAFKTPTVRNIEKTFPYMHNGAFGTLEKVLEFYNLGGGEGMGLTVPVQTLSPKPLNLNSEEVADIIAFMHTLTDEVIE